MTSSSANTRHLGRIVDPLARDDGALEPDVQLVSPDLGVESGEGSPSSEAFSVEPATTGREVEPSDQSSNTSADSGAPSAPAPDPEADDQESPVSPVSTDASVTSSDSDLGSLGTAPSSELHPIRAKLLARAATHQPTSGLDEIAARPTPRSSLDRELEDLGTEPRRAPSAPRRHGRRELSPNMVAVFGTLLGCAAVASITALLTRVEPRELGAASSVAEPSAEVVARPKASERTPRKQRIKVPGPWRIADAKGKPGLKTVKGQIGREPFLKVVQDSGVTKQEAYRVLSAFKGLVDLNRCKRSDQFLALVDRKSSRVAAFEYIVSKEEVYQAKEQEGALAAKRLDLKIVREQLETAFVVTGSFSRSAADAGLGSGLGTVLAKALEGHLNLSDIGKGDRLRIIAQEITVLGEHSRYAGVEAVEIIKPDGDKLRVYYFAGAQGRGYYDHKARAPYEGGWRNPVKGAPVTSKYNPKRLHPVLKKVMPHTGTDFGAPSGTPVGASNSGKVTFIGYAGASGNLVKVQHAGGIETGYAHLSRFAEGLKVGDKVKRMQLVGYVGSTGRSTGPHLHFTAKRDGKFFDAETLNLDALRVLPVALRGEFEKVKVKYDQMLDAIPLPEAQASASLPESEPKVESEPEPPEEVLAMEPSEAGSVDKSSPASASQGSSIHLSDEELLKLQGLTDDGEIEE